MDSSGALIDGEESRLIQALDLSERCAAVVSRAYGICKAAFLDRFVLQDVVENGVQFKDLHTRVRVVVDPAGSCASPDTLTLMSWLGPEDEVWLDEAAFQSALERREGESQRRRRLEALLAGTAAGRELIDELASGTWRELAQVWAWRQREELAREVVTAVARRCRPAEWRQATALAATHGVGEIDPLVEFVIDVANALRDLDGLVDEPEFARALELVRHDEQHGLNTRERAELHVRAGHSLRLQHAVANGSLHRWVRIGCTGARELAAVGGRRPS